MTSLAEQIFSIDDISRETMVIPEWGDLEIAIHSLTALERTSLTQASTNGVEGKVDAGLMYALMVVASVHDPKTGEAVFTENDKDAIMSKNGAVIERIAERVMGKSGFTKDAVEKKQEQFPALS